MPKSQSHPFASMVKSFTTASGVHGRLFSLPALAQQFPNIHRLPMALRIVLKSVLRHRDGQKVTPEHVAQLANWQPNAERSNEIPFVVSRVLLQDFTGVPLLADLAAMRSTAQRLGLDAARIEPLVPVDLVVDHSAMVDHYGKANALDLNMKLEFQRNRERHEFLKWGMQAFSTFNVVPPGFGIVHQVNLEYLARGVHKSKASTGTAVDVYYPDTLVGTDSHTTMINGLGVVGWGVGGIEAEAAMLGQPVYLLTPDVVGFGLQASNWARSQANSPLCSANLKVRTALTKPPSAYPCATRWGPGTSKPQCRPRRRADRRHHQLHQYVQPQRDACCGSAGQESGAGRAQGRAPH
jgi:aconitate hydratase